MFFYSLRFGHCKVHQLMRSILNVFQNLKQCTRAYMENVSTKSLHTVAREEKTSLFINVSSSLNQERQQCSIKLETCETINFGQCYIHIYTGDYTYLPIDTGINIVSWDGVSIFLGEWQRHESTSPLDYKVNWNALQLWEH